MRKRKLQHLTSEVMARDGYSVKIDPMTYPDIHVLATSADTKANINKYYIVISGRTISQYLTKGDMKGCLPRPMDLSENSRLLIVSSCRSSSKKARDVARNDPTPKKIWYVSNLLQKIRSVDSEYLIDIYDTENYNYRLKSDLKKRMNYQGIDISDECLEYITEDTYHPRKIVAYIEMKHRDRKSNLNNIPAVEKFRSKFPDH